LSKRHAHISSASLSLSLSFNKEVMAVHAEQAGNRMAATNVDE